MMGKRHRWVGVIADAKGYVRLSAAAASGGWERRRTADLILYEKHIEIYKQQLKYFSNITSKSKQIISEDNMFYIR